MKPNLPPCRASCAGSPRPEHLERRESVHRLDGRGPVRAQGRREAAQAGRELLQREGSRSISHSPRCSSVPSARCGSCSMRWIACGCRSSAPGGSTSGTTARCRDSTRRRPSQKHGEAQVKIWRRSYDIPPPPLAADDPRHPRFDARYAGVDPTLSCPRPSRSKTPWRACCRTGTSASRRSCAPAATCWSWPTATACARMVKMLDNVSRSADHGAEHPDRACRCSTSSTRSCNRSRAATWATPRRSPPPPKRSNARPKSADALEA